jgi:DNA-binding XRE family transcriptional regulator
MKKLQTARLASVAAEAGMNLSVSYTDGRIVRINLSDVANRLQAFSPLEKPLEFATVRVADFGWTLEWDCGASLDSDRVLELALEQAGMAENVRFRQWQDANHLSLSDAAKAIGMTRRTISKYRTGSSPVPRYITLACKGWEAEQQGK